MKQKLAGEADLFLLPGDLYIAHKPMLIKTLLGSCVSVILYNKRKQITAISHAQLPDDIVDKECIDGCPVRCDISKINETKFKYVTCSTKYMIENFFSLGIKRHEIDVKNFGGSDVIDAFVKHGITIGSKNIETAHDMIKRYNLKIVSENTGGRLGRTIYLHTSSNEILIRKHRKKVTIQQHPTCT